MTMAPTVDLDDPAALAAADPEGMLAEVAALGSQLRRGFQTAAAVPDLPSGTGVREVVVCGMGGSGVAGDVTRALYADRLGVPVVVVKGYRLPEFAGRDTLVFAVSFSGNTEETLAAYAEATERGCRVVAVSAGGELAARAAEDDAAYVPVPPEVPMPRAAIGYLATAPLGVLDAVGLVPPAGEEVLRAAGELDALAGELGPGATTATNEAKAMAGWIGGRTPVIWGSEGIAEAAALRWRTQVNENAKGPAFWNALSELDHNEIEGWAAGSGAPYALVVLRHGGEHPRTAPRLEATLAAIQGSGLEHQEVWARGGSPLAQLFSLVMLGDFASAYLGILRGVDPMPVPVLMSLKERLRS